MPCVLENAPSNKDIKGKEFFPSTIARIMEDEVIDIDDDDILDTKTINEPEILTKEIAKDDSESSVEVIEMEVSDIENNLESTQFWKECFNTKFLRFKTLEGCSHHCMIENGKVYGEIVDSYFAEYD